MTRDRQQKQDRQEAEKGRILAQPTQPKGAALGGYNHWDLVRSATDSSTYLQATR